MAVDVGVSLCQSVEDFEILTDCIFMALRCMANLWYLMD